MPAANILPYADQPELTPGLPQYYATAMTVDGLATGLLVESHEGRPTKIEGNPQHPASLGAAGVLEQASVLQLYDPHRASRLRHGQQTATWSQLAALLAPPALATQLGAGGRGLFLLLEPTSSPLEAELIDALQQRYPQARVHFHAPLAVLDGALVPQYAIADADVIVAVDADFLTSGPFHLRYAREFAARRRPESAAAGMNRCYALESDVTATGMTADHRVPLRPDELAPALQRLLALVSDATDSTGSAVDWISVLARDLRAHAARSVVIAGPYTTPAVRGLALAINQALGNVGRTVWFTRSPIVGAGDTTRSLATLVDALRSGEVHTLACAGGNPGYASAGRHELASLLRRTTQSVYLGMYENETARECAWFVPAAHYLETWGDARAHDGTLSIVQPLIDPLPGVKTTIELLSVLLGAPDARPYDLLRDAWRRRGDVGRGDDFEEGWRRALRAGVVEQSAFPREVESPAAASNAVASPAAAPSFTIVFRPHSRVRDGAFANNGWLQELPDPVTTLTWDNAAHVSPATARRLQIESGDLLDVSANGHAVRVPALVVAGHADDVVTLQFGYGRQGAEALADGRGGNVYPLWPGDSFVVVGAGVARADAPKRELAITQPHHEIEAASPARVVTLDSYQQLAPPPRRRVLSMYQPPASLPDAPAPQQWAMTIDLGACTGCGACVVACQAENNVPVVGPDQVGRGREMHWLRIDWYSTAPAGAATPQPMLCQHCEKAPCEYVCPVEATVHSSDGLNEMVYNRCVGTRFCSNNCPYKVRRFNWFDFNAELGARERLVKNPDVTVRERGVMEKCTFCVQRIRQAEIAARVDHRPLNPREVRTACQQACPTEAIVFGSITDADGDVSRGRRSPRAYAVLEELGTEPRIAYLARVRNPHPDLERRS